jgi:uncharacterized cupin superfamily protein
MAAAPTPAAPGLHVLRAAMPGTPEIDHPKPERRLRGCPERRTWNSVDVPIGGTAGAAAPRLYCGVWRCDPGEWHIRMGAAEQELFTVLEGRCRVHAADGSLHAEAGAGEAVFIPAGFEGRFEVIEAVVKTYAIVA